MHFIGNSVVSLATLAAVLTVVYAAPAMTPDTTLTISDDLANQLDAASKRDTYTYTVADDLADHLDLAERDVTVVKLDTRDTSSM
ncbi:uncharacterized protein BKCO1_6800010 [Diplodia corticola]|uniref:Uncharacterized protein n=1 Tax=Diplodia corticola TaxID=236234 RepID=A0A1J9QPQ2_9PEZI|nr:uncharacterized protein BKCO1_6800010 [Diplodia corticola]OJD30018.1 hypothetical protein BKCO1_6800010 [Diplodia corticola]